MAKADPYDCLASIDITASRRDRLRRRLDTAQEASHDNITPGLDWVEEMLDNTQRAISLDRFAFMQQAIVAEKAVNFAKTSSRGNGMGDFRLSRHCRQNGGEGDGLGELQTGGVFE